MSQEPLEASPLIDHQAGRIQDEEYLEDSKWGVTAARGFILETLHDYCLENAEEAATEIEEREWLREAKALKERMMRSE